jgi:hypothetical protein
VVLVDVVVVVDAVVVVVDSGTARRTVAEACAV